MFGVLAQNAQIYTLGIDRFVMLMHLPWSHISHDSLTSKKKKLVITSIAAASEQAETVTEPIPLNHEAVALVTVIPVADTPHALAVRRVYRSR